MRELQAGGVEVYLTTTTSTGFRIANDRIFGIGKATLDFCNALRTGAPWWEATQYSAGNGALMRIAPLGIFGHRLAPPELGSEPRPRSGRPGGQEGG